MDDDSPQPPPNKTQKDRRRSPRSPTIVRQVNVEDGRKTFIGHLKNLSRGGMFIATMSAPGPGTTFEAEFVLPDTERVLRCTCRVVWRQAFSPAPRTTPGMGVQFIELDHDTTAFIQKWVDTKPRRKP
jgi:uncharacterized protein (TIGR02266 family)